MNRRAFFASIVAVFTWRKVVKPIPVDIIRRHREAIIAAFASDSYVSNAFDIQITRSSPSGPLTATYYFPPKKIYTTISVERDPYPVDLS